MADVSHLNTTNTSDLQAWIPEVGPKKKRKKSTKPKKSKKTKASTKQKKGKK